MLRNLLGWYFPDVAHDLVIAEICHVCVLASLVPFAREDASPPCSLKGKTEAADAGEQIYETEWWHGLIMPRRADVTSGHTPICARERASI